MYDVFISYKKTDERGNKTEDQQIAQELYERLERAGLNVFFSQESLEEIGSSRYKNDIDRALDSSRAMVVVLTKSEYASTKWVQYEWDSFYNDFLSGLRKKANLYTLVQGISIQRLPRTLRNVQSFDLREGYDDVVNFLLAALNEETPVSQSVQPAPKTRLHIGKKGLVALISAAVCLLLGGGLLLSGLIRPDSGKQASQNPSQQSSTLPQQSAKPTSGVQETKPLNQGGVSMETPEQIVLGQEYELRPQMAESDRESWSEWFSFVAPEMDSVCYFQCDSVEGYYKVMWQLYDENEQLLTEQRLGTVGGVQLEAGKRYYLSTQADGWCTYRLITSFQPCDAGTGLEKALPITPGISNNKRLELPAEEDWFTLTASQTPAVCRIEFIAQRNDNVLRGTTHIGVYDKNGRELLREEYYYAGYGDKGITVDYLPEPGEPLYLCVSNDGLSGDYRLTVTEKPCDGGTSMEKALSLEIEKEYSLRIDSTIADWVVFSVKEPGTYQLNLLSVDAGGSMDVQIYIDGQPAAETVLYDGRDYKRSASTDVACEVQVSIAGRKTQIDGECILILKRID